MIDWVEIVREVCARAGKTMPDEGEVRRAQERFSTGRPAVAQTKGEAAGWMAKLIANAQGVQNDHNAV